MTNREYAELLDYVSQRTSGLNCVNMYKIHSTYDTKTNEIIKITLKLNYTKDGTPLPDINSKLTKAMKKNIVQRTEQFRGDSCSKEEVAAWVNDFMITKENQCNMGVQFYGN